MRKGAGINKMRHHRWHPTHTHYKVKWRTKKLSGHGHPRFYELLEEIAKLHSVKNRGYANREPLSNLRQCEQFGIPAWKGTLVRLGDKWSRIMSLVGQGKAGMGDESLKDTLKDMAVYSLLCVILLEEAGK